MEAAAVLDRLSSTSGDVWRQAAIAVDYLVERRAVRERPQLREALDAAAVLNRFDEAMLSAVMRTPASVSIESFRTLCALPFIEPYGVVGEGEKRHLHESVRLGLRATMANERAEDFRALSLRAAQFFETRDAARFDCRFEQTYHYLAADPRRGVALLRELVSWRAPLVKPKPLEMLSNSLDELLATGIVVDDARTWCLMAIARLRGAFDPHVSDIEHARELQTASERSPHELTRVEALLLLGDLELKAGVPSAAQALFVAASGRLTASPRLSRRNRVIGSARCADHQCDVFLVERNLAAAREAATCVIDFLMQVDPTDEEDSAIRTYWLVVAKCKLASILRQQDETAQALRVHQDALEQALEVDAAYQQAPNWQRQLASIHSALAETLKAQDRFEAASDHLTQSSQILESLSQQEISNAKWQGLLATSHVQRALLERERGNLQLAGELMRQAHVGLQALRTQEPGNTQWSRDLSALQPLLRSVDSAADAEAPITVAAAAHGAAALTESIERHHSGLLALLTRQTSDRDLAADALQQAYAVAYEHMKAGRMNNREHFSGYVFQVAINTLRNHRRRPENRQDHAVDPSVLAQEEKEEPSAEFARQIQSLVSALPTPRDREIVKRFYLDEEDKGTICADLGISTLAFDKIIHRARQRMRALLESQGFLKSGFF